MEIKIWVKKICSAYSQNVLDHVKQSATGAVKTVSQIAIQKTAEATGDLITKPTHLINTWYIKLVKMSIFCFMILLAMSVGCDAFLSSNLCNSFSS